MAKTSLKKQMLHSKPTVVPSTNCCAFWQTFSTGKKANCFLSECFFLLISQYIFQPYYPIVTYAKQASTSDVTPPTKEIQNSAKYQRYSGNQNQSGMGDWEAGVFSLKIRPQAYPSFLLMVFPLQLLRCFETERLIITDSYALHTSLSKPSPSAASVFEIKT